MKDFNEVIKVEVSVNSIALKLMLTMNPEEKHGEMIVESIIGGMLNDNSRNQLSNLYNALNGYTNDINFKVGDAIECTNQIGTWEEDPSIEGGVTHTYISMGAVTVKEVDVYKTNKLLVEYSHTNKNLEQVMGCKWVSHLECSRELQDFHDAADLA